MSASHYSIFTDWMLFLTPDKQCQSTEGNKRSANVDISTLYPFSNVHLRIRFLIFVSL